MSIIAKQIFFSHTWRNDKLNRNTHNRVLLLVTGLQRLGWGTWVDEQDMIGNIDASMARGIQNCECVLVCLTEEYCKKVNEAANNLSIRDNCHKEWNYANICCKLMIPIIMENDLLDIKNWPLGVVPLHLGTSLYIDATKDDLAPAIMEIHNRLIKHQLCPKFIKKPILRKKSKYNCSITNLWGISWSSKIYNKTHNRTQYKIKHKTKTLPPNHRFLCEIYV